MCGRHVCGCARLGARIGTDATSSRGQSPTEGTG